MTPEIEKNLHFDIDPSIVFQLGENLITDVIQALIELIKNSYDADSTYASVTVDTKGRPSESVSYQNAIGYVVIEDGGSGMDADSIERGWLLISNALKRTMKREKKTTGRGRTPLGDKGLGRLGAQRLGNNVEIFTRTAESNVEYYVAFSWKDFHEQEKLSEVNIKFRTIDPPQMRKGTKLIISDLRDVDVWQGESAISKLESNLSRMISPFKELQDFVVAVRVDGKELNFAEISEKVRETALVRYIVDFDEDTFNVKGKARLDFLKVDQGPEEEKQLFRVLVESDDGEEFLKFLSAQKRGKGYFIKRSQDAGWFIEYEFRREFSDFDKLKLDQGRLANPGSFHAEIDYFNLRSTSVERQNIFDRTSDYRNFIKELSGIRVFRNGFGIRVDEDWLKISKLTTSGKSHYGLRPENTLGYVALTSRDNAKLEETTDREGFKITPYYENFFEMMQQFIKFTTDAQTFIRRGWNEFREKHRATIAHVEEKATPEKLSQNIGESLSGAQETLTEAKEALEHVISDTQNIMKTVENMLPQNTLQSWYAQESTKSFQQTIEQTKQNAVKIEKNLNKFANTKAESEVLSDQVAVLREQLSQAYEIVSLGLTAETLSHEINNIASQLAERNQQVKDYLKRGSNKEPKLISFTEYVDTSVAALRKQLAHLSPSLKYVREKRENIKILPFFREIEEYHTTRFNKQNISIQILSNNTDLFVISMNRGKLTQIIDNLLLNSEYWLREDMRLKNIDLGIITVEIAKPFVRISDNGRGVDPSVEDSLFEPFVTAKGRGVGRGLGLFIVRQLLDSEACTISLLPKRNEKYHRLYEFEIDFTGGLVRDD